MFNLQSIGIIIGLIAFNYSVTKAAASSSSSSSANKYYGTRIGSLSTLMHDVSGDIYAVDSRTIFIKNFVYDGQGPAAQFLVGTASAIGKTDSFILRDERGTTNPLPRYRNKDITLTLPEGKTLRDIRWLSVWCYEFSVDFGNVRIPSNIEYPKPQKISQLKGVHGVSSDPIVIVDAQTLLVPNFSYDGEAPDAKFWAGSGARPTPNGILIPDENGRITPLMRYDKKTIVLTLPDDLTVFDIGHFGVWCVAFTVDFGHIQIPDNLNIPPSLKMLGISPQSKLNCEVLYDDLAFEVRWAVAGESVVVQLVAKLDNNEYMSFGISPDKDRTIMVGADVVVAWVDMETGKGYAHDYYLDAKSQCSGKHGSCPDTRLLDNSNSIRLLNAAMVNGYSIVTYQRPLKASDRFDLPIRLNGSQAIAWAIGPLNQRQEVSFHSHYTRGDRFIDFGRQAVWNCPLPDGEMKLNNNDQNNNDSSEEEDEEELYNRHQRPQQQQQQQHQQHQQHQQQQHHRHREEDSGDNYDDNDDEVRYNHDSQYQQRQRPQSNGGNRNQQVNRRKQTYDKHDDNGYEVDQRPRQRPTVPTPKPASRNGAWEIPAIQCYEPEDGVFYAQMGPTGGKHGYSAITGHVGWGISWYINGLLIPELNVVRGKTYTFIVESGDDPDVPAKYHPFYITDDPVGGYEYKTDEEKENINIYAGVQRSRSGAVVPIGVGRSCYWTPDSNGPSADEYTSFGAYQRTLSLKCDIGEPGVITWRPDENTPDTVYYQCFTHRYLGWKINVRDYCDDRYGASDKHEVFAEPESAELESEENLESEASIKHETKVNPNEIFLLQHEKDLIKNHNMNEQPPKVQFDINRGAEITKIIAEGIKAAEALEESIAISRKNLSYTYTHDGLRPTAKPYDQPTPFNATIVNLSAPPLPPPQHSPSAINVNTARPPQQPPAPSMGAPRFPPQRLNHPNEQIYRQPSGPLLGKPTGNRGPPIYVEQRRRPNPNQSHQRPPYPIASQPSLIVSHYKKPVPPFMRPFVKQSKPIKPLASVLVLGQQSDIGLMRKNFDKKTQQQQQQQPSSPALSASQKVPAKSPPPPPPPAPQHHHNGPSKIPNRDIKKPLQKIQINRFPQPIRKKPISESIKEKPLLKNPFKLPYEISDDRLISAHPIYNNGFHPESVVVESGFRPIVRRRNDGSANEDAEDEEDEQEIEIEENANRRKDDIIPDVDEAIEGDALFINQETQNKAFEPMFIPSPPDSLNTSINRLPQKPKRNRPSNDLQAMNIEDGDDKLAMAGERVDAYYLPPDSKKKPISSSSSSSLSAAYPEGTVVTYDGKALLDTSLINIVPPPLPQLLSTTKHKLSHSGHLSRSEQLVRNSPQFGPFTGDIPPPIPEFVSPESVPQLKLSGNSTATAIHQHPVTEYTHPLSSNANPISTKLTLLSAARNKRDDDDNVTSAVQ